MASQGGGSFRLALTRVRSLSDIQEVGTSVVSEPSDGHKALLDLVFIHGLGGHPVDTWAAVKPKLQHKRDQSRSSSRSRQGKESRKHTPKTNEGNIEEKSLHKRIWGKIHRKKVQQDDDASKPDIIGLKNRRSNENKVVRTSQSSTSLSGASLTSGIGEAQEDSTSNQDQRPIITDYPPDRIVLSSDSSDKSLDKIFWPRDILSYDERFQQARILTCGYDSRPIRFLQGQDRNGIKAHADAIMEDLIRMREADSERHLIFIVHSLGGIILKEILRKSARMSQWNPEDQSIYKSTRGIAFIGTPHHGSKGADWAEQLEKLAFFAGHSVNTSILEDLRKNSKNLEQLNSEFTSLLREARFYTRCFYESSGMTSLKLVGRRVVNDTSASIEDPVVNKNLPLDGTHSRICKFVNKDESGYIRVSAAIQHFINEVPPRYVPEKRSEPAPSASTAAPSVIHLAEFQSAILESRYLDSLAFPEMGHRQDEVLDARADSCAWILQHKEYTTWRADNHGLLWIQGKPGSGKSTLMKRIFREFNKDGARGRIYLAFFFHKRGTQLQQTPIGMFRTMIYQLLSQVPSASADFQRLYEEKRKFQGDIGKDWEWRELELRRVLESSLVSAVKTHSIIIFVDALDEAGEDSARRIVSYLHEVNELLLNSKHATSICFSCRHFPIIKTNSGVHICVEDENHKDISTYTLAELQRQMHVQDRELGSDDLNLLQTRISNKASGVFLWVTLVIPVIVKQYNEGRASGEIFKALEEVPSDLGDIYKHILMLIDPKDRQRTLHLMQWICLAERPLSLAELRFALASDDSSIHRFQYYAQESTGFVESDERMKKMTIALSGGLAEVKFHQDKYIIQFIHQSVNDFLLKDGFEWLDQSPTRDAIGRGHDRLSRSCINYLKLEEVQNVANSRSANESTITANLPFSEYATKSWFLHAQKAESWNIPQRDLIQRFQWPSAQHFLHWIMIFRKIDKYDSRCPLMKTKLMHLAAASNLESIVRALLESETPLEAEDDEGNRALHYAARWGHKKIVSILLDANADIDARNTGQRTPLERAAAGGHEAVVELLLEKGAEVNYQTGESGSALQSAALKGSCVVVKLLLDRGADINAQGGEYGNSLQAAAYRGSEPVVRLLLDKGANIHAQGGQYGNALQAAALRGSEPVVKLLLDKSANISCQDNQGRCPLHLTIRGGHQKLIDLVLADIEIPDWNYQDQQGCSALHFAASDTYGWTALHWACRNGSRKTVQILRESGADSSRKDIKGWTPLDVATFCQNDSLVSLFQDNTDQAGSKQLITRSGNRQYYYCSSCYHNIYGSRYNCKECRFFDLCFRCIIDAARIHQHGHRFEVIV
ncbi:hypothetical protein B0O99DRAFT_615467, partial [Bisporella sp. PMI_857]